MTQLLTARKVPFSLTPLVVPQPVAAAAEHRPWNSCHGMPARIAIQKLALSVTLKLRGSTGWKWMSFTPPAASPGKRDA